MSLNSSRTKLARMTKDLSISWKHTKSSWKDDKCLEFQSKYMDEIITSVRMADKAVEELGSLMAQMRSDCE